MYKILFGTFLVLSGCMHEAREPLVEVMTPRELNIRAKEFDGHEVTVRGYLIVGTNGRAIYESKKRLDDFRHAFYANTVGFDPSDFYLDCLTLLDAQILVLNRASVAGQTITVRGRFHSNYLDGSVADLQACGGATALSVDPKSARDALATLPDLAKRNQ